jgi:hypothetical protein
MPEDQKDAEPTERRESPATPTTQEVFTRELIKFGFVVGAQAAILLVMLNWSTIEHWLWRARTFRDRKKREEDAAKRQVQWEISQMEHGEFGEEMA